jgi:hypothetical protein
MSQIPEPSLPDWRTDSFYEPVFRRAQKMREDYLLPLQSLNDPPRFVLVEEHEPFEGSASFGETQRAWTIDIDGSVCEISIAERDAFRAQAEFGPWPYVMMMFHLYPDMQHLAFGICVAPRFGHGEVYKITRAGSKVILDQAAGGWIA